MELLPKALLISAIGMGLVFMAIFVLWGLMALLVKLTTESEEKKEKKEGETAVIDVPHPAEPDPIKTRAAAAAVATALALAAGAARCLQPETDPATSPWKEAHRALEINRRSGCFNR